MLTEQELELLTAFVDGELAPHQREAVMRLLNASSEARDIVRQMQENAHKLKQLPQHKVEPSLVDEIVQAIAAEKQSQTKPAAPAKHGGSHWLPYVAGAMAASLLIGAIGLLYYKHMIEPNTPARDDTPVVKNDEKKADVPTPVPNPNPTPTPRKHNPLVDNLVNGAFDGFGKPIPVDPIFTAKFSEFKDGQKTMQLAKELQRGDVVQLDVTVKGNKFAIDRLKDVLRDPELKPSNLALVADPSATKKLADKVQGKVEYFVYAENLTPDEATKLMRELSKDYVLPMGANQKNMTGIFNKVTVAPASTDAKTKLDKILGESGNAQPDQKKPRQIVVLPINANGAPSPELAQFLKQRQTPQAGSVRLLIKIHE